jgi:PAS domain S-box-containing protein
MLSILYVDDEPGLLEVARLFLEHSGEFRVTTSISAQKALDSPEIQSYDAIISDYQMPGMDGIAFLKAVRQRSPDIPFILFTGRGREEVVIEAINNGADFYLQKGGDPKAQFAELMHKIRQAVARRHAERSLLDSERRLSDIINFLPDATFAIDNAGNVIAWNRAMEEMTGTDASEVLGRGNYIYGRAFYGETRPMLIDLVLVSDERFEQEEYSNTQRDGTTLTAETIRKKQDGTPVHFWGKASRLYDKNGNLVGAIESVRDITERRQNENELHMVSTELQQIFRNMINAFVVWESVFDENGTYVSFRFGRFNDAYARIAKVKYEDVRGKDVFEVWPATERSWVEVYGSVATSGIPRVFDMYHEPTKGWYHCNAYRPTSSPAQVCVIFEDITERRKEEEELREAYEQLTITEEELRNQYEELSVTEQRVRESEQRFRSLIQNSSDMIRILDRNGLIAYSSPSTLRIFGYDPADLIGKDPLDYVHPDDRKPVKDAIGEVYSRTSPGIPTEYRIRHHDGHYVDVESIASNQLDTPGIEGVVATTRPITERKAAQSAMQAVVGSMVGVTGLNSLRKITENICSWLGADCVMVGEIQPDGETVRVLAMRLDGKNIDDFSYTLKGTPCENVAEKGFCLYPDNAIQLFPESRDLVELNIRGYIGTPLRNSEGEVSGILCALSKSPIQSSPSVQGIMDIIAVKAAAEIERIQIERELRKNRQQLEDAMELAHLVNWEYDLKTGMLSFDDRFYALCGTTANREGGSRMSAETYAREFVHPDDRHAVSEEMEKASKSTDPDYVSRREHRIVRRDGEVRHVLTLIRVMRSAQGRAIKAHGTIQDFTDRMRAEEALRESEGRFRALFENANDAITVNGFTPDGLPSRFIDLNENTCRLTGYTREEILSMSPLDLDDPETGEAARDLNKKLMKQGDLVFERIHVRKDGQKLPVEISAHVFLLDNQKVVLSVVRDITERKRAGEALRKSEERFRGMAERSSDLILILDKDMSPTYVAPSARSIIGYDPEELVGKPPEFAMATIFSETGPDLMKAVGATMKGRPVENTELRVRRKDGTLIYVNMHAVPVLKEGVLAGVQVSMRDITSGKKAELAHLESEEKFRSFVENANEIVFSLTPDGIFTYVSPNWAELLGHDTRDVIGRPAAEYIHPDDFPRNRDFFLQAVTTGKKMSGIEYRIRHKDGTWRWHSQSISPVRDTGGRVVTIQGICHDVTERRQAEEALRQAQKKLNLLSSITRHDISNQLLVLNGFIRLLQKKIPDPSYEEYFSRVSKAGGQITAMIHFTREYEKIGVQAPVWHVLATVVSDAGKGILPGQVTLNNEIPAGTEVFADPLIVKAFFNLLDNSVRHGQRVTEIRVSTHMSGGDLVVVWEDNGVGIAREEKEQIFERGFGKNTGLGMFLVREILSLTGITITETGEPGTGARFEIVVPNGTWREEGNGRPGEREYPDRH